MLFLRSPLLKRVMPWCSVLLVVAYVLVSVFHVSENPLIVDVRQPVLRETDACYSKWFVYDLAPQWNLDAWKPFKHVWIDPLPGEVTDPSSANTEIYLHHALLQHRCRTVDPRDADFFYVPLYWCMLATLSSAPPGTEHSFTPDFLHDAVRALPDRLLGCSRQPTSALRDLLVASGIDPTFFDRRKGADHIVPSFFFPNEENMIARIWAAPYIPVVWTLEGLDTISMARISGGHRPISVPFHAIRSQDSKSLVDQIFQTPLDFLISSKEYLCFFAGSLKVSMQKGTALRTFLREELAHEDACSGECLFLEPDGQGRLSVGSTKIANLMSKARFCPVLPGDTYISTRLFDAIVYGCVPVLVGDMIGHLPFENSGIDYSKFMIQLPESVLRNRGLLISFLRSISPSEIRSLLSYARTNRMHEIFLSTVQQAGSFPFKVSGGFIELFRAELDERKAKQLNTNLVPDAVRRSRCP